jgi:hypothetical protein
MTINQPDAVSWTSTALFMLHPHALLLDITTNQSTGLSLDLVITLSRLSTLGTNTNSTT